MRIENLRFLIDKGFSILIFDGDGVTALQNEHDDRTSTCHTFSGALPLGGDSSCRLLFQF